MRVNVILLGVGWMLLMSAAALGEEIVFEDDFDQGLSSKWKIEGLKKEDYRIRDGALEMRVQPGKFSSSKTPMIKFVLPDPAPETVIVSVKVTILDEFSRDDELAGVYLLDKTGLEFGAKKQRVGGKLVFAPGKYEFRGKPDEKGDVNKYTVKYTPESKDAGALRIIVDRGNAFFQVGPSEKDEYLNFFFSAIGKDKSGRGFGLVAEGAPDKAEHWVRFDDFKVTIP